MWDSKSNPDNRIGFREEKNLVDFMNPIIIYKGSRQSTSLTCLANTYTIFCDILSKPEIRLFQKALCLRHFNKYTHMLTMNLMNNLDGYKAYMIDGIFTPYVLYKIIDHNKNKLLGVCTKKTKDKNEYKSECQKLELTAIENNPDYILNNIEPRDLEFLNYLIDRTAKTIMRYYIPKNDAAKLQEFIGRVDSEFENFVSEIELPAFIDMPTELLNEILCYKDFSEMVKVFEPSEKCEEAESKG